MDARTAILTDFEALRWQMAMGADEALGELPMPLGTPEVRPSPQRQAPATEALKTQAKPIAPAPRPVAGPTHTPPDLAAIKTLPELKAALESINTLGIKETAMSFVFGEGAPHAPVMLVGEAPGEEEDRTGRPFIGRAGQLLEKMLAAIGLSREQVYITNVLPWRPPGNRTPKPEEVATCLPYLMRHIELVQPKLLLMLGGPSAKALLGKEESVTRLRGIWWDYHSAGLGQTLPALVTYHPAYLLRSPAQKRESWRDLRMLKHKIDSL
jgi:uracil-DNA glycosylase